MQCEGPAALVVPHATHPANAMTAYDNRVITSWHHHIISTSAKLSEGLHLDQLSARSVREAFLKLQL